MPGKKERRKWAKYPKIPQDLHSFEHNNEIFTKTVLKERFLLVDFYDNDHISGFFVANFDRTFYNLFLHLFFSPII